MWICLEWVKQTYKVMPDWRNEVISLETWKNPSFIAMAIQYCGCVPVVCACMCPCTHGHADKVYLKSTTLMYFELS